jgi:transcriptional regulator with XRE-family HTH domain
MSSPDEKSLGKFIRRMRKHRKLKGVDLARALGKSPSYVCDLEKGRRGLRMSPEVAVQIAEYLNIPLHQITSRHTHLAPVTNTDKLHEVYRAMRHKGRAKRVLVALESLDIELESLLEDAAPSKVPPRVSGAIFKVAGLFKDLKIALTQG